MIDLGRLQIRPISLGLFSRVIRWTVSGSVESCLQILLALVRSWRFTSLVLILLQDHRDVLFWLSQLNIEFRWARKIVATELDGLHVGVNLTERL